MKREVGEWFKLFKGIRKNQTRADMVAEHLEALGGMNVYAVKRTPEQEEMYKVQLLLQEKLGFEPNNGTQNWLRLHQLLLDYENRIAELENKGKTK